MARSRSDRAAPSDVDVRLRDAAARALRDVSAALDELAIHQALACILELVAEANRYADSQQPWTLSRRAIACTTPQAGSDLSAQLAHVLWHLLEALRVCAILLAPFLPDAALAIVARVGLPASQLSGLSCARFGLGKRFRPVAGPPLFPKLGSLSGAGARVA